MATKLGKLKNLMINRVAFCAKGSNPGADIVIFKSDPVAVKFAKAMTTNQILAYNEAWDDWYDLKDAFMQSVWCIMNEGGDAKLLEKTVKEFAAANAEITQVLEQSVAKSADGDYSFATLIADINNVV